MEEGSRQQIPEMPEREEMASSNSIELQPISSQRKKDQQEKNHHSGCKNTYLVLYLEMLLKEPQSPDLLNTSQYGNISGSIDLKNVIICDISDQLHDWHDIDININLNLDLPTNQSDKNSSDLLSTSSTTKFEIKYQELKKHFGQNIPHPERGKQYDDIMSLHTKKKLGVHQVVAGPLLLYLVNHYRKKHKGIGKQYAFAVVVLKDRLVISAPAYPKRQEKNKDNDNKHSEEFLIEKLCTFFQKYRKNVENIYIYTTNSPCLKREKKHLISCMFKLLHKSCEWLTEYGFLTTVIFSEFYGFSGSNYFQKADISDILDGYSNKCQGDSFVLNYEDFNKLKPGDIRTVLDIEPKHRKQQLDVVNSALKEIKSETKNLCLINEEYLNHGKKIIQDKMHNQPEKTINTLIGEWNKMVDRSFEEYQRKQITSDFNTAVVHVFEKELKSSFGSNCPLQLYHLVSRSENILN
uniref:uncharacterized protein LOC124068033 isoform X2 n=1 Tax=Scatophagus argus TaxID=75038 RepID=UPI001ED82435|nr:uncharacterized protein LOC124068033 isoform X2 [Scatophagus argus]